MPLGLIPLINPVTRTRSLTDRHTPTATSIAQPSWNEAAEALGFMEARDMPSTMERYAYVDTLRGMAILMVILVHTSQMVPGASSFTAWLSRYGQMGVQLFFVASAHTLCLSFSKRDHEPLKVLAFYLRRIFRIAPLYYCGIVTYLIIFFVKRSRDGTSGEPLAPYTWVNILSNVFLVHGLVPEANNSVVPGGWSIGTEALFYLLFPLLFFCCNRAFQMAGTVGVVALIALTAAANVAFRSTHPDGFVNNSFLYFNIVNQLPVFLIGMLTFYLVRPGDQAHEFFSQRLSAFGFLVFTGITGFLWSRDNSLLFAVIPSTAAVSFLCLLLWVKGRQRTPRLLRQIGKASYSMYVFHFIFAWYLVPRAVRPLAGSVPADVLLAASFFATAALSLATASVSERLIERNGIAAGSALVAWLQGLSRPIKVLRGRGP